MFRSVTAAFAVAGALACGSFGADDKDPVKDKLFAAKVAYDGEMREYRKVAREWFDKREEDARKDGNKTLVDQIKEERRWFDESGEVPKGAPSDIQQKPALARKALEAAYAEAVKDYTKAKKDDEAAAVEAAWKTFVKDSPIDLIPFVDPKKHAVFGEWKMSGQALMVIAGDKPPRLLLPYEPGDEYDVVVRCRRIAGNQGFSVGLVAGVRQVLAVIDGWPMSGHMSGLDLVDKKGAMDNVTTVKGEVLKSDVVLTITCSVRNRKIDVSLDGKMIYSFKGEFARLSVREELGVPNKKALFLGAGPKTTFQFDRIIVTPVKGKGSILK